jgi:hypothetical protein
MNFSCFSQLFYFFKGKRRHRIRELKFFEYFRHVCLSKKKIFLILHVWILKKCIPKVFLSCFFSFFHGTGGEADLKPWEAKPTSMKKLFFRVQKKI